jgi:RimJ/RimL family protein N-acetyltransferase
VAFFVSFSHLTVTGQTRWPFFFYNQQDYIMNISTPLFEGKLIQLGSHDYEKDPQIESGWTHDPAFMRMMYTEPMRPLSPFQLKKKYEALEKEIKEEKNLFHFRIRNRADERLLGFGELFRISWPNGSGHIRLGIGSPEDLRLGFGSEALSMLLRYAFSELNLYRLSALIPEYNPAALAFFTKAGFREEVRRREALARDGRYWDASHFGLLSDEWKQ